jgi:hypothetical protein
MLCSKCNNETIQATHDTLPHCVNCDLWFQSDGKILTRKDLWGIWNKCPYHLEEYIYQESRNYCSLCKRCYSGKVLELHQYIAKAKEDIKSLNSELKAVYNITTSEQGKETLKRWDTKIKSIWESLLKLQKQTW